MPRKRQREKLAHRQLTWGDVFVGERLDFWVGWHPPTNEFDRSRSRWATWQEFLSDWVAVRAEALVEWEASRAEQLTHARAEVARRAARLAEVEREFSRESDGRRDHWAGLLAWAEKRVEELEGREAPFAELAYRRVLAGEPPDGRDDEADDDDDGVGS